MMWILLVIILIIIILVKVKILKKKALIAFGIIICVFLVGFLIYHFLWNYINPNWMMKIERADIDGFSNKVYIYANRDVIIEDGLNLYTKRKSVLNETIDLEQVKDYIMNSDATEKSYKVELNKDKIVRFISSNDEEISEFINALKIYMTPVK